MQLQTNYSTKPNRKKSIWKRYYRQWDLQLIVIPPLLYILLFHYVPMWGVIIAFKNYSLFTGVFESPWVGFAHFKMFLNASDFSNVIRNTIVISFLKLFVGFPAPIVLAIMLNEIQSNVFRRSIQTITYLPHFISWVVVAGFVFTIFSTDGSANILLNKLGFIDEPVKWLNEPNYFWGILVTSNVWKEVGFGAIIYLAAIAGIDPSLYEAAEIDGAGKMQKIFRITLPCISPVIIILLILNIGNLLNAGFEDILLLTNNGQNYILRDVSDVIDTYVFRTGIQNNRYSYAAAVGLFKAIISVSLLVMANMVARKMGKANLW